MGAVQFEMVASFGGGCGGIRQRAVVRAVGLDSFVEGAVGLDGLLLNRYVDALWVEIGVKNTTLHAVGLFTAVACRYWCGGSGMLLV